MKDSIELKVRISIHYRKIAPFFLFWDAMRGVHKILRPPLRECVADSVLQSILDDDSDKLFELISLHFSHSSSFFLPNGSKMLPSFLHPNPLFLSVCCFFASMNCFRLLLSLGFKADDEDDYGRTPIHLAAAGGSLEIMREIRAIFMFLRKS